MMPTMVRYVVLEKSLNLEGFHRSRILSVNLKLFSNPSI